MSQYANKTEVSPEKSRMEIETTLRRYGADGFMYGHQGMQAMVAFTMKGRSVKFILPMPDPNAKEFSHFRHASGQYMVRSAKARIAAHDQAQRQRWRALALCIKAKLEAIDCGITSFEHEFLAHFIASDGKTVGEHIIPQLADNTAPPRLALLG